MRRFARSVGTLAAFMAVSAFAAGACLLLAPGHASALDNQYWDDSGATCDLNDCSGELRLVTSQTRYVRQSGAHAVAYFKAPTGTLTIYDPNWCPTNNDQDDYLQTGDYFDGRSLGDGANVTKFVLSYPGWTSAPQYGEKYDVGDQECNDTRVFNITGMPQLPNNPDLYYVNIDATYIDKQAGAWDGISNLFYFEITSGNGYAIAQQGGTSGYEVTVNQRTEIDNLDIYVKFGSDCTVPAAGVDKQLSYYDLDNAPNVSGSAQQNGLITMELWENGTRVSTWTPPDQQNVTQYRTYHFKQGAKYEWRIKNVYKDNTLQFSTPFDGIYWLRPCLPVPSPPPPPPPPPVGIKPFFEVNGGDTVAGASFATDPATPCGIAPHLTTAGISSWNNHGIGPPANFAGAGGQYAAFAMGILQDFVTGQGNGVVAIGTERNQLSFANRPYSGSVNYSAGLFGGMFNGGPCVDYWNNKPATTPYTLGSLEAGTTPSGAYTYSGNLTLNGITIGAGKHIVLYVNGNVNLRGIIQYIGGTYTARQQVPSFKLIVNGSIFVQNNVNRLDGFYAAIPDTGTSGTPNNYAAPLKGTFVTCSNNFTSYDPTQAGTNGMVANCNSRLTVNGSVAAQQIWLLRTFGGLAVNSAAEIFNYTPELWLSPEGNLNNNWQGENYESIKGLPPIL